MNKKREKQKSCVPTVVMLLFAFFFVVCVGITSYHPDRPVERIEPASSSGPAFVVQVIRPRSGLPLGGILPPTLFGVDAHLGFDSETEAAAFTVVDGQIDFSAEDGVLKLTFDSDGNVTPKTELVFELIFEDRLRTVRCRPGDPAVGSVTIIELPNSNEVSGHFDLELSHCEDAETGESLGWPPSPFILRGSFDRLIQNHQAE